MIYQNANFLQFYFAHDLPKCELLAILKTKDKIYILYYFLVDCRPNFHFLANSREILEACQRLLYKWFVYLEKAYGNRFFVKSFREFCGSAVLTAAYYWSSRNCVTLTRRAWVRLNRLRTGVGLFRSCLYK